MANGGNTKPKSEYMSELAKRSRMKFADKNPERGQYAKIFHKIQAAAIMGENSIEVTETINTHVLHRLRLYDCFQIHQNGEITTISFLK